MLEFGKTPVFSKADAMEAVKLWVVAQEKITLTRGRRHRPGVEFLEEPTYIDSDSYTLLEPPSSDDDFDYFIPLGVNMPLVNKRR